MTVYVSDEIKDKVDISEEHQSATTQLNFANKSYFCRVLDVTRDNSEKLIEYSCIVNDDFINHFTFGKTGKYLSLTIVFEETQRYEKLLKDEYAVLHLESLDATNILRVTITLLKHN